LRASATTRSKLARAAPSTSSVSERQVNAESTTPTARIAQAVG